MFYHEFCDWLQDATMPHRCADIQARENERTKGYMMKKLGFGLMRLPVTDPTDAASVDLEDVAARFEN